MNFFIHFLDRYIQFEKHFIWGLKFISQKMIFKTKKSETEHKIPFSKMIKKKVVVAIEIFSKHVPKIVLSVSGGGGFWEHLEIDEKEVT